MTTRESMERIAEFITAYRASAPDQFGCYDCNQMARRAKNPSWPVYPCDVHGFNNVSPEVENK